MTRLTKAQAASNSSSRGAFRAVCERRVQDFGLGRTVKFQAERTTPVTKSKRINSHSLALNKRVLLARELGVAIPA